MVTGKAIKLVICRYRQRPSPFPVGFVCTIVISCRFQIVFFRVAVRNENKLDICAVFVGVRIAAVCLQYGHRHKTFGNRSIARFGTFNARVGRFHSAYHVGARSSAASIYAVFRHGKVQPRRIVVTYRNRNICDARNARRTELISPLSVGNIIVEIVFVFCLGDKIQSVTAQYRFCGKGLAARVGRFKRRYRAGIFVPFSIGNTVYFVIGRNIIFHVLGNVRCRVFARIKHVIGYGYGNIENVQPDKRLRIRLNIRETLDIVQLIVIEDIERFALAINGNFEAVLGSRIERIVCVELPFSRKVLAVQSGSGICAVELIVRL